jgi:tricorn protease-like protein
MQRNLLFFSQLFALLNVSIALAQSPLSVEKIMQDPKTSVGALPSNVFWAENSQQIYFNWQTGTDTENQLYSVDFQGNNLKKVDDKEKRVVEALRNGNYNATFTKKLFTQSGDIFLYDIAKGQTQCLTFTVENENNPRFLQDES